MHLFLIFVMSGKAFKSLFFTLWPEGSIMTLKKTMDLVWDKTVEYNMVFKGNSLGKAMQELLLLMCHIISYFLLFLYILT